MDFALFFASSCETSVATPATVSSYQKPFAKENASAYICAADLTH
jgi:hypothetical protein